MQKLVGSKISKSRFHRCKARVKTKKGALALLLFVCSCQLVSSKSEVFRCFIPAVILASCFRDVAKRQNHGLSFGSPRKNSKGNISIQVGTVPLSNVEARNDVRLQRYEVVCPSLRAVWALSIIVVQVVVGPAFLTVRACWSSRSQLSGARPSFTMEASLELWLFLFELVVDRPAGELVPVL